MEQRAKGNGNGNGKSKGKGKGKKGKGQVPLFFCPMPFVLRSLLLGHFYKYRLKCIGNILFFIDTPLEHL